MKPNVVVDTNIVVSALITKHPQASTKVILEQMITGQLKFFLSAELVNEYLEVLCRPNLQKLHRLSREEIELVVSAIVAQGQWCIPTEYIEAPDRNDSHLWTLLKATPHSVLVTGDKLLLENPPDFARVRTPGDFLGMLEE